MLSRAMPAPDRPSPEKVVPPGLTQADMTELVLCLPHGRGVVRLAGYYQLGRDIIVVYDVLDEDGTRLSDIRVAFPPHQPLLAAGTVYSVGAAEV